MEPASIPTGLRPILEALGDGLRPVLEAVNDLPLAGLMLVVSLGYALSRVTVREVSIGAAGSTLFVALALGWAGIEVSGPPGVVGGGVTLGTLGFALFIYSVGFDAAPHFFSGLGHRRSLRYLGVAVAVNGFALAAALVLGRLLALGPSAAAGVLAGALTSGPTYAAAAEVAPDVTALSVAFALTYPVGLVGVVLGIQLVPRWRGRDLAQAATADEALSGRDGTPPRPRADSERGPELTRSFEVREASAIGVPLRELDLKRETGCIISRVRSGGSGPSRIPDGDTALALGDVVTALGRVDELRDFERRIGPETWAPGLGHAGLVARRVEIREREATARNLAELRLIHRFHVVVTRIDRGRHRLEPEGDLRFARGDVVELVGRADDVRAAATALGRFEPAIQETDMAAYAGGLVLGLAIGAVRIPVPGLGPGATLGLGTAGGLLLAGLLLGWRQRLGPFRTYVPREARQLVRDLGILLFVGETGLHAGAGMGGSLGAGAGVVFGAGATVSLVAVAGGLVAARRVLRLREIDAWGSVAGGLTSSAALQTLRRLSDSNEAAMSYAAAYAIGSVLATLAGPLVVLLLA